MNYKSTLLALSLAACASQSAAQVLTDFVNVSGTFQIDDCGFDASQYQITRLAAIEGLSNDTPALRALRAQRPPLPAPARSLPWELDVGVNSAARTWSLKVAARLSNGDVIYSRPRETASLTNTSADVTGFDLDIETALVTIQYRDSNGDPVVMTDSDISFYTAGGVIGGGVPVRRAVAISSNKTGSEHTLLVRAGEDLRLRVAAIAGTDIYSDTNDFFFDLDQVTAAGVATQDDTAAGTIRFLPCENRTITVTIPTGSFGTVRGTVDMVGATEEYAAGSAILSGGYYNGSYVDTPVLRVWRGRTDGRLARRLTAPFSGEFVAQNLLPTGVTAGDQYFAQATLTFKTDGLQQVFRSPILREIDLAAGENLDLDRLDDPTDVLEDPFVLSRGLIGGRLEFCGPPARDGQEAMLSNANGASGDGNSFASATDRGARIAISSQGPAGASSSSFLAGIYNAGTGAYTGDYQYAAGGLYRADSDWRLRGFNMRFVHSSTTLTDDYYNQNMIISPAGVARPLLTVRDGETTNGQDYQYDFGEVLIRFRASDPSEEFYGPVVLASGGKGLPGDADGYSLGFTRAFGLPARFADSATVGTVRMLLPEGTFNLRPSVNSADTQNSVAFPPLAVQVEGKSFQIIDPPLQPPVLDHLCFNASTPLTGRIVSRDEEGNEVMVNTLIFVYDGVKYEIPITPGVNPAFSIDFAALGIVPLAGESLVTLVATSADGRESRIDVLVFNDDVPPVLNLPEEIVANADPELDCAAIVKFDITATDNCPGEVTVTCDPPSGSEFPVGVTEVTCTATDHAGNVSKETFNVRVNPYFRLRPGVYFEWDPACSVLQCTTDMTTWADVPGATSPHCEPTDAKGHKFYRLRPIGEKDLADIVVTSAVSEGDVIRDAAGRFRIPFEVTIANRGYQAADSFKLAVTYPSPRGGVAAVAGFQVPGQGRNYPFTPGVLDAGAEITFTGFLLFPEALKGEKVEVTVEADSCFAEEFQPAECRVPEIDEKNNFSEPVILIVEES